MTNDTAGSTSPPFARPDIGTPCYDHKGFNWRALREQLTRHFRVERILSSPLTWLPPHLASQAWFILQQKDAPA